MLGSNDIDETTLNAYVDGQLDLELQHAVLEAMRRDALVRDRVSQLRMAKDWMRAGFSGAWARPPARPFAGNRRQRLAPALAASLAMLTVGIGGGALGYYCAQADRFAITAGEQADRIVLHLDDADPQHFRALLDYAEQFLRDRRERGAQVEVVTNAAGIDLMRSGVSPYEARIEAMLQRYPNLHFIACATSIRQLQKRGEQALLITDVHTGTTAVDHIVSRLRDGWSYRKIAEFSGI